MVITIFVFKRYMIHIENKVVNCPNLNIILIDEIMINYIILRFCFYITDAINFRHRSFYMSLEYLGMYTLTQSRPRRQVNCISPAVRCHCLRWPIFHYILWEKFVSRYLLLWNTTRGRLFYLRIIKLGIPLGNGIFLIESLLPKTHLKILSANLGHFVQVSLY